MHPIPTPRLTSCRTTSPTPKSTAWRSSWCRWCRTAWSSSRCRWYRWVWWSSRSPESVVELVLLDVSLVAACAAIVPPPMSAVVNPTAITPDLSHVFMVVLSFLVGGLACREQLPPAGLRTSCDRGRAWCELARRAQRAHSDLVARSRDVPCPPSCARRLSRSSPSRSWRSASRSHATTASAATGSIGAGLHGPTGSARDRVRDAPRAPLGGDRGRRRSGSGWPPPRPPTPGPTAST